MKKGALKLTEVMLTRMIINASRGTKNSVEILDHEQDIL